MSFEPVNGDHAIYLVTFSVMLNSPLTSVDIKALRANHKNWRNELPANGPIQAMSLSTDANGMPKMEAFQGHTFSIMRPDGTPAWTLRTVGFEVAVDCFRYTRWDKTWTRAARHLASALEIVEKPTPKRNIVQIGLSFIDQFIVQNPEDDPHELLQPNSLISEQVLNVSPFWHQHSGWFKTHNGAQVLNQLNIDSKSEEVQAGGDLKPRHMVVIQHSQQWRPGSTVSLSEEMGGDYLQIREAMTAMHDANKDVIDKLLTSKMKDRIGLNSHGVS